MPANPALTVLLADPMEGVRAAWRWLLASHDGVAVAGEASMVTEALDSPGEVVLSGLRFADGAADRLIAASARPVVVWTFLPPDERAEVDLADACAVIGPGELRARLGEALRVAAQASAAAAPPRRAARRDA